MNEQNATTKFQARGCIQFGDLLIFMFGSFIMFAKTADILTAFAPMNWFGMPSEYYGLSAALLIEGFLVWRKVKMWLVPPKNFVEWAMDIVTTFIPFGLSLMAQIIDGFFSTQAIQNMTEQTKITVTVVVSALIAIPLFLDIAKTSIDNAPAGIFDAIKSETNNGVEEVGSFFSNLFSRKSKPVQTSALDTSQVVLSKPSKNGKGNGVNP